MEKRIFGTCPAGTVEAWTLRNANGMEATVLSLGGTLQKLLVPADGEKIDVCLGYQTAEEYYNGKNYYGAIIGRYANRIGGASFSLNGCEYRLAANEGENQLHGGPAAFDKKLWRGEAEGETLHLFYRSPDGENGFPGALDVRVDYTLTADNALRIDYIATPDRDTPVSLTNHTYFNLNGGGSILDDMLEISAEHWTAVDAALIPTGKLNAVAGTSMDFRTAKPIGRDIDRADGKTAGLYDYNFCLGGSGLRRVAVWRGRKLTMEMETTAPGMQLYCAPCDAPFDGKTHYEGYCFACMEAQSWPDSVHHENFPNVIIRAGETYRQTTIYRFRG